MGEYMKDLYINCPRCTEKKSVLKREVPGSGTVHGVGTCGGYLILRIIQWKCGYCSYHKVSFNIDNQDWMVLE